MKKVILLVVFAAVALVSCEKFGERNISKSVVVLLSPTQGQSDSILSKLFWWEEIEGADSYHLQVVSTSFDNITSLVVDTLLSGVKFQATLSPGEYQWRVRAENGAYESPWTTYNLTITNTNSLTGQTIANLSPDADYATSDTSVNFSWTALSKASSYNLLIEKYPSGVDVLNVSLSTNSKTFDFTSEGTYVWSVQGINNISASLASNRYIIIDKTKPNLPILTYPVAITDTIFSLPATFTYDKGTITGSVISDSIYISSDSTFSTNILYTDKVVNVSSFTLSSLNNTGKLFWRVRSIDAAGNKSGYSVAKPFFKKN